MAAPLLVALTSQARTTKDYENLLMLVMVFEKHNPQDYPQIMPTIGRNAIMNMTHAINYESFAAMRRSNVRLQRNQTKQKCNV